MTKLFWKSKKHKATFWFFAIQTQMVDAKTTPAYFIGPHSSFVLQGVRSTLNNMFEIEFAHKKVKTYFLD